jgi:hypothetical protein
LVDHVKPGGRIVLADRCEGPRFPPRGAGRGASRGFARATFGEWLRDAGFDDVRFSTACSIRREDPDGATRAYPVFLAVACKRGA